MTPPNFALYLACLFVANMAPTTTSKQASLHFESVDVGAAVTLPCFCKDAATVMFYWYKQTLGQKPKLMSTFYRHNDNSTFQGEFMNNLRFSLDTENSKYHLKISDLHISDSATYYCVGSNLLHFEFCDGTTVSVKGSGLNVPVFVNQSASESVQPGGSATLSCTVHTGTCDGGHSVYWFKNSEESHPGLIYTHGDGSGQCERKDNTETRTCVYNLENLDISHAGTYYCAVVSCGHILFGNGTKLDFEDKEDSPDSVVYFLSGALAFTTILVLLLAVTAYKMNKRGCQCSESATSTTNAVSCQDAENLHYAAVRVNKASRPRRQTDNTQSECVYSSVKQ